MLDSKLDARIYIFMDIWNVLNLFSFYKMKLTSRFLFHFLFSCWSHTQTFRVLFSVFFHGISWQVQHMFVEHLSLWWPWILDDLVFYRTWNIVRRNQGFLRFPLIQYCSKCGKFFSRYFNGLYSVSMWEVVTLVHSIHWLNVSLIIFLVFRWMRKYRSFAKTIRTCFMRGFSRITRKLLIRCC